MALGGELIFPVHGCGIIMLRDIFHPSYKIRQRGKASWWIV